MLAATARLPVVLSIAETSIPIFRGITCSVTSAAADIWTVRADGHSPAPLKYHLNTSAMISSFGEGENGELWMTDYAGGGVYRVIAPEPAAGAA